MYSTIKKKKCKCSLNCKFYPSSGYVGYYYKHAPVEIKERQDTKTGRQRSDANKRKLQKVNNLRTPENDEAVKRQIWFSERRAEMSGWCLCGCSEKSSKDEDKYFKFSICHILPQRHFKSVQWHRLNWIEMNFWLGHHTNFDNQGSDGWDKLACWPEIVRRFKVLYPLTYTYERQFIPKILQQFLPELEKLEEPNCCAFCGKPTRFPDDKFCNELCELDYNYVAPPKTIGQVIRMGTEPNGDLYVAE